jgi:hypothetical protein
MMKFISEFMPGVVVIDPVSGLDTSGTSLEVEAALMRLVDFLKQKRGDCDADRSEGGRHPRAQRGGDFFAGGHLAGAA